MKASRLAGWGLVIVGVWGCMPPEPPPPRPPTPRKGTAAAPTEEPAQDPQAVQAARTDGLTGGRLVFEDRFDRAELGEQWLLKQAGEWTIDEGWLHAHKVDNEDLRNQGVWLQPPLPEKVRISFKSRSLSNAGDTKCEVFGTEAKHESGYSIIFGGWNNTLNVIARKGEHEAARQAKPAEPRVVPGRIYSWTIVRTDDVVRWYLDGRFVLAYPDTAPVRGRSFGFNNWASDVRFKDLQIYALD